MRSRTRVRRYASPVVDKLIADIKLVLPEGGETHETIRDAVNDLREQRDGDAAKFVTKYDVDWAMSHLRKWSALDKTRYGWDIGYAQRGTNDDNSLRYHVVDLLDPTNNEFYGTDKMSQVHLGVASHYAAIAAMLARTPPYAQALADSPSMDDDMAALLERWVRACPFMEDLAREISRLAAQAA